MTIRASGQFERKWKFRSRLTELQNRKLDNGLITTLCTYVPRGKKYPYASAKRGVK
jgi:hypothetical protein